ncbi:hypothetical protein I316_06619 [Kwoniella heveanensis BCC8398]|uniref:Protein MON2 homolog n=1 Tax=Kwoniella heveanensis BCC8398 TaxID=1296120 RepID=A0A1B9GL74_9TREE|nr:hypothetical protein I316_06619 [Kwoniella heveanensis BCC8398]
MPGLTPQAKLPDVLHTLSSVANQAVDIQLKILQTLLSILTYNRDVHDEVLGNALLLCFKLQDSRVSVVSSTAAATLRQAVMSIFDRVSPSSVTSSANDDTIPLALPSEPPTEVHVSPSALDAYNIFSDLCLLTASAGSGGSGFHLWGGGEKEKPKLLKLSNLHRTFGLELIESILSGYEEGRPELLFLLQHSLDPLLLKLLAEKPTFPIALRVCRLIFLLVRSFTDQMPKEVEAYLLTLIKLGMGDAEEEGGKRESGPPWLRVLALEILRGICGDPTLLQKIYNHYDKPENDGLKLYSKIVLALSRLVNEKPALLGIGSQMHGIGVPHTDPTSPGANPHASYLDLGLGMVSSAASVGVSTVNAMMGAGGGGLGAQSMVKLRLIEQHDKAEAPLVPETYIYLLALQSLDALATGIYVSVANSSPPPPVVKDMASSAWPALLAALSYCIGTNLSDAIFAEVLAALQDFTVACGLLDLTTPRDAFLSTLGKYAVPPPVVSAMQSYMEAPNPPRNPSVISADALGFSALGVGGPTGPPSLSERNLACLRSTVNAARVLGPSLGKAWHDVLETLQNANFMLAMRKPTMGRRPTQPGGSPSVLMSPGTPRPAGETSELKPEMLQDLDGESIQLLMNALFDSSRDLPDEAFTTFISALCQLSSEMIGMNAPNLFIDLSEHGQYMSVPSTPTMALSPSQDGQRRRTSGINISHSIKSGERSFSLTKLRVVTSLNLNRLISGNPELGWTVVTQHLLSVARHLTAPSTIRIQASDALGEVLLSAVRIGKEPRIQHQVFDVLVRQVDIHPVSNTISTDYDVRSAGYQTLNSILESSGHSLSVGWSTIFGMLDNVCQEKERDSPPTPSRPSEIPPSPMTDFRRPSMLTTKGNANLVRIAFPSLTLICSDFLTSLDANAMRSCIACLGHFGEQKDDVNITLAAIGLLWNVSDAVQADSKDLWLCLLTELLELGRDPRLEVRSSAMQTLFRCVELYGSGLSSTLWEDVLWKVIFPLLDSTEGDDSSVLALTSVGSIFGSFLLSITSLEHFDETYDKLMERFKKAFLRETRKCGTAALKALEKVLSAVTANTKSIESARGTIVDSTWKTFVEMGTEFSEGEPYTQDNLVALVQIAKLLYEQIGDGRNDERSLQLSAILRSAMTYTRSPDYRPDTDTMSPLQTSISSLLGSATNFSPTIILSDLAEFMSLAYVGVDESNTKLTYVALSKWCMPKLAEVFSEYRSEKKLYDDGTIETMIGAYSLPIRLKYDCPPANRFGEDPPLWRSALSTLLPVLEQVLDTLSSEDVSNERFEGIWSQVIEVFSGVLLADSSEDVSSDDESFVIAHLDRLKASIIPRLGDPRLPDRIISQFADVLRKASVLYHYDARVNGGTTAPGIPEAQEQLRYWALETLVASATRTQPSNVAGPAVSMQDDKQRRVAGLAIGALLKRYEIALVRFLEDKKLRGDLPFGRTREEEILFILRHLATMQVWEGGAQNIESGSQTLSAIYDSSSRWHLFYFYPLLLEFSFIPSPTPSMWLFPSEHAALFSPSSSTAPRTSGESANPPTGDEEVDAGDGGELIEVNAKDLARRCLELIGEEMGMRRDH